MPIYRIDGFAYTSKEQAKQAKKEKDGIAYIRQNTNLNDPDVVLRLYNKMIDEKFFETEVGITFLKELQQELIMSSYIADSEIKPIPVREYVHAEHEKEEQKEEKERLEHREKILQANADSEYKTKFYLATFFAIIFAVALLGIFSITYFSGSSKTILNYEEKITDQYSSWEVQLKEKEQELNEREQLLKNRLEQLQMEN